MSNVLKRGDITKPETFHPLIFGYFTGKYEEAFTGLEVRKTGEESYHVTAKFLHRNGEREVGYSDYIGSWDRATFRKSIRDALSGICDRYERMINRHQKLSKPKARRAFDFE